ncbi:hypothetical protein R6258_07660 [Halomonas sp. HP20-15]|uniref:hypothetical protein n=1 Tax=Halomonas sp. HP20-15 TaxID=3085901 RepID=UPI0029814532|nr:hypothetical protein [Halomonas sp. HP20-15]MDW5376795.1 hypothetical protein [Halomonas sp. HP20-15]
MSDKPIEPRDYTLGLKVVDIGDIRVARGETRRPRTTCRHRHMVYDQKERRVWCEDCESEVEAFDALMLIAEQMDGHIKRLQRREREVSESEQFAARMRATKELDRVWRTRNMTPTCPHCVTPLLPEDFANGCTSTSREFARAARQKRKEKGH